MANSFALPTYSAVYAFGDSLSDAGNVSLLTSVSGTEPVSPPYAQETYGGTTANVFSNGPTWVQTLSGALGLGTLAPSLASGNDFAYGGAETGSEPQNSGDPTELALSLPAQLQQFQTKVSSPSGNALYTLSIGGNDIFAILSDAGLSAAQQSTDVADAVDNEIGFVKSLISGGAKNLLVMDVPDLGKTPSYNGGTQAAEASALASAYNTDLFGQLATLATGGVRINIVDSYRLIDQAVADPAAYGLSNVTSPVWSGNFTSASSGTLVSSNPAVQNTYLFFDHEHPTETGHNALASAAEQQLGTTGLVDLPAGQYYAAAAGSFVVAGGSDTIAAAGGLVSVQGSSGALLFVGGSGASVVNAQGASATIFGGTGGGTFAGGSAGHNILISEGAAGTNTTLVGGGAGDRIFGSAAGNDVLSAGTGGNTVLGGGGNTTLDGGASAGAVLFAGTGPTTVSGGSAGGDTIVGGSGTIAVTAHGDAVIGGAGAMAVAGGTGGADSILGGSGALGVTGQGSNMLVVTSQTSSTIETGNGASLIFANAGSSTVTGGSGSLQMVLGAGNSTITEGSGASLYEVTAGSAGGSDVINGFRPTADRIDLFGYTPSQLQITSSGGSSLISLSDGTRIQITGVTDLGGSIVNV